MTKPLAGIQWALVLGIAPALFGALSAPAQVSPETRARLLREFEEKNRSKHTEKSTDSERPKADPNVGLEELRGNLSKARTRLLSDRSKEAKEDAARAALLYADSLLRLGRTEEAISVLTTTLAQGADEDRINSRRAAHATMATSAISTRLRARRRSIRRPTVHADGARAPQRAWP